MAVRASARDPRTGKYKLAARACSVGSREPGVDHRLVLLRAGERDAAVAARIEDAEPEEERRLAPPPTVQFDRPEERVPSDSPPQLGELTVVERVDVGSSSRNRSEERRVGKESRSWW